MDSALRALNRFGLGARIDERRRITDPRGWLRAQLDSGAPLLGAPDSISPGAIGDALRALRAVNQGSTQERRQMRRRLIDVAAAEADLALTARATSDRPFVERLVAFWSNHLCVSTGAKLLVAPLAGSYEREAIRPHVLGRFEDMLLASARHPAMLVYLDNFQSIGPASRAARAGQHNAGARRGLNENYARELLELHTLGVNGGYSQQDVQELARVLTGWTVDGFGFLARRRPQRSRQSRGSAGPAAPPVDGSPIRFAFYDLLHEPGTKTVLGQRYDEDGVKEGERVIRMLCRQPSTSQLVARKLVAHFVSDDPPPAAVERVARAFRASDGDLKVVARALVDEPEAWRDDTRKFRTPQDWLVSVLRAFGATEVGSNVPPLLRQLRQPLWSPAAPKGYGDTLQEWADPDSLMNRGELARSIANRVGARAVDPVALLDVVDVAAGNPVRRFLSDSSIPVTERIALARAGPAFQWR
jgi:uncharacterized protein (DUF1800 family)